MVVRDNQGKAWVVFRADLDVHVCVAQIHLGEEDQSVGRVCIYNIGEQTPESPPKLD